MNNTPTSEEGETTNEEETTSEPIIKTRRRGIDNSTLFKNWNTKE